MLKKYLLNSKQSSVEVFNVTVQNDHEYVGFWDVLPSSSIQPSTFMGIKINGLSSDVYGTTLLPGTTFTFQDYQAPVQNVTVIRLDSQLTVKLEKQDLFGSYIYYSEQQIFFKEDAGKTIKIALIPS